MWRVIATFVLVLGMIGCGADGAKDMGAPPPSAAVLPTVPVETVVPTDDSVLHFNGIRVESAQHQATQLLSPLPQQRATSRSYVVTVSMF